MVKSCNKVIKSSSQCKAIGRLLNYKDLFYDEIRIDEGHVEIYAHGRKSYSRCPICGAKSHSVHSHYVRVLSSLPLHGKQVLIRLTTRRFRCKNSKCPRHVFSEQIAGVCEHHDRRTACATELLENLLLEVSARKGAFLSRPLGVPVSASTCLRILYRIPTAYVPEDDIHHICIDDFAFRKGKTYGTMIVEALTHQPLELFEGRTAEATEIVLSKYQHLKTVSRDRACAYAAAIEQAHPGLAQVADRFHLMQNCSRHLSSQLKISKQIIRDELLAAFPSGLPPSEEERQKSEYMRSQKYFEPIRRLLEKGLSEEQICKRYHYKRLVVKECMREINRDSLKQSQQRLDELIEDKKLRIYVANPEYEVNRNTGECSERNIQMTRIIEASKTLSDLRSCYLAFQEVFRKKDTELLDRWIEKYRVSRLKEMASFSAGIEKDIVAVKNAIIYDMSNGPIEGLNNKLKAIKRQMYGRAGYRLLMLKMSLSKTG